MNKQRHTETLAAVVVENAPWHSSDGWYCDRCDQECGATYTDLCRCCSRSVRDATSPADLTGGIA